MWSVGVLQILWVVMESSQSCFEKGKHSITVVGVLGSWEIRNSVTFTLFISPSPSGLCRGCRGQWIQVCMNQAYMYFLVIHLGVCLLQQTSMPGMSQPGICLPAMRDSPVSLYIVISRQTFVTSPAMPRMSCPGISHQTDHEACLTQESLMRA